MKCVVGIHRTGHVRVSSAGMRYQGVENCYTLNHVQSVRPNPNDRSQHRRFVGHNGVVYYVTANHRVYETNIVEGQQVSFNPDGWTYDDQFQVVPVTMRKMEKVEWVFT